ncbi:MAG: glycerophosphodiester phosphodiesterase family protein [bacterium]|nr:glycerophosphodiester phosphodiesterase family protein [bacterium]
MRSLNRIALLLLVAGLAPAQHLISPVDAIHLAEAHVRDLTTVSVTAAKQGAVPIYTIDGAAGGDGYQAIVDARVARTLRVTKNGQPFYEWEGVIAVGHRGTVRFAPENTVSAINKAIDMGIDLIEIDVRETADGHLVVVHDATVDRTTDGKGWVSKLTLDEIRALDAGSWFSLGFKGEKIPTFDEALEVMKGRALPDVDFKAGTPRKLVDTLARHGLLGKVTLYCGDWDLLRRTLELSKDFHLRPTVPGGRLGLTTLIETFNPPIVNINWKEFSEALVRDTHISGRKAFLNTMGANDTRFGLIQAIDAGADYLQSDRPDLMMPLLRARGLHR